MASVFQLNQFPCKSLFVASPPPQFASKPSILPLNSIKLPTKSTPVSTVGFVRSRPVFRNMAVADDELGPEEYTGTVGVATEPKEVSEIDSLKKELVGLFHGTDRGLKATTETRAEIVELITKLETKNPTPAPTEALTLLNGKWILAYTSFADLFPLLATGTLPLVKVEEISQTIDSESSSVQNSVQFSGPLGTASVGTNAKFEVQSPKRLQIKFEEGIIRTPQLTDSIVFPENAEFLGQKIDLTPFNGLITSVQDTASYVANTISSQPPLKFPISNNNEESWLLTTYLDEELRISKGDGGSVFVLIKEGSSLLTP